MSCLSKHIHLCFHFNSYLSIFYNVIQRRYGVEVTLRNVDGCYVTKFFSQDFYVRTIIQRGLYDVGFGPVDQPTQKYFIYHACLTRR